MKAKMFLLTAIWVFLGVPFVAAERHMMRPVVPVDKLAQARALKNPLANSPDVIEQGKSIYNGKGGCVACHGIDGDGKGPGAVNMNPSPRNFQHHGFWRHRTEGEVFWVIKHGSPGTAMIAFGSVLSDEEIWALIQYEHTFASRHGPGRRGHRGGMGPMRGSEGGMGGMEGMGHRRDREGEAE